MNNESKEALLFIVGYALATIIAILILTYTPFSERDMCRGLSDNGYKTTWVEDLETCMLVTESGELVPFTVVPLE